MTKPPVEDRRAASRLPVGNAVADCRRLPMAWLRGNVAERVLDLSAGGARLVTREALAAGLQVRVRIGFPGTAEAIETPARVVWSYDARSQAAHVVGVDFLAEPSAVQSVLDRVRRRVRRA